MGLSVGIITYNEEKRLERTIKAVENIADEIVIVDSGSTDKTAEIAKKYKVNFFTEKWKGYGLQKNSVIDKCEEDWILLIDADEVISEKLEQKILKIIKENKNNVYEVNFTSVCLGKKLKHGGWSGSYRIRLFKNGAGRYNDNIVHEAFISDKPIEKIKEDILHYSYENLHDYIIKFDKYTTEGALDCLKKGKKSTFFSIVISPFLKFIRMYIFRLGFLDGIEGLVIAIFSGMYTMTKYYKLRELEKK